MNHVQVKCHYSGADCCYKNVNSIHCWNICNILHTTYVVSSCPLTPRLLNRRFIVYETVDKEAFYVKFHYKLQLLLHKQLLLYVSTFAVVRLGTYGEDYKYQALYWIQLLLVCVQWFSKFILRLTETCKTRAIFSTSGNFARGQLSKRKEKLVIAYPSVLTNKIKHCIFCCRN